MNFKHVFLTSATALALAGCVSGGGTATEMVTATSGMRGVMQATEPPSREDYALSCSAVNSRILNLYARYAEIEADPDRFIPHPIHQMMELNS